ncbi:MAG: hypothetical protein LBC96_07475, partial [Lachnospiraceae bacterium]|nr:hypothetical protein [Lachnospiraceae bacterium]
ASILSGTPASQLPDGETGGYQLEIGNSSNIVIIDEVYHHGISMMTDADIETEGKLRYVITRLEDVCHTLFKMPATTAKIEELLGELKAHMNGYRDHSIEARRITQGYMIQMSFYDQGETRVYNDYSIREYIRTCSIEVSRQISSLNNKKNELTADLYSSQYALSEARSLLDRLLAEQSTGDLPNPTQLSSVNSGISGLSDKIASLSTQICEIEECIDYLRTTLHKANSTIEDLLENVQSVDRSYTLDIEALNDWTQQYINRMREIGDSIGGVMQSAVTSERIGMLSCPATLDTLLEALGIFEEKDRTAILEIVADAPKLERYLFFMFANKIDIATLNAINRKNEDDEGRPSAWFDRNKKQLHLNMELEEEDYYIFFHEIGHMIYFLAVEEMLKHKSRTHSVISMSQLHQMLYNALKNDVENQLRVTAHESTHHMTFSSTVISGEVICTKEQVINVVVGNILAGREIKRENATTEARIIQLAIQDEMSIKLSKKYMITISDLYGGMTNNVVVGSFGHSNEHWLDTEGNPTYNQQHEFFAGSFSTAIRRNDMEHKNQILYLKESTEVYNKIVSGVADRTGARQ